MRTLLRRLGLGVGILAGVLCVAAIIVYALGARRLHAKHDVAVIAPRPADSTVLARGERMATTIGKCGECHGDDLGGKVLIDDPVLGRVVSANLTRGRGGAALRLSDDDFARAIRFGVRADGSSLLVMPSHDYTDISERDFAALVVYLRSLAPVNRDLPKSEIRLAARALLLAGKLPGLLSAEEVEHANPAWTPEVSPSDTVAYGSYLAHVGGCAGCHGPTLAGGPMPGGPPDGVRAANLTRAGVAGGTEADFAHILRTGVRPGGSKVREEMPIRFTRSMTDEEIHAVWTYLRSLPAVETGGETVASR